MEIRRNVLLADANEEFRTMLREEIERSESFAVVGSTGNGTEALELAGSCRPDLLVMDVVLPCEGQEIKWADSAQEQYRSILRRSSDVVYVSRKYTQNCMLERNRYLVDHASILVAVCNGTQRSGTGATVRYAQKQGREIFIIDPISRTTTYFPMNSVRG